MRIIISSLVGPQNQRFSLLLLLCVPTLAVFAPMQLILGLCWCLLSVLLFLSPLVHHFFFPPLCSTLYCSLLLSILYCHTCFTPSFLSSCAFFFYFLYLTNSRVLVSIYMFNSLPAPFHYLV